MTPLARFVLALPGAFLAAGAVVAVTLPSLNPVVAPAPVAPPARP